ncbi:hypothetical protein [Ralstonia solanacearum]|uniref:Acetyl-CoA C-acyltransferase n=1 Tax=Ralstonia solanacearum TaxID=305 RepID=A0AAE3NIZ1_RALSL|nr:hypothetical protein [Ralstonia solanacearum]MBB6583161.1 hypothetical protein [Ralstonia solanacearum]MDB0522785.1 hypothetical protein [Ralstonia solanacearum]
MLVNAQVRRVAILGGNRIPFARANTAYATASNPQMLTAALQGLVDRFSLHGRRLDEVVAGAVIKHARDFNLTRESVLSTTLARQTPAFDRSPTGTLTAGNSTPLTDGASCVLLASEDWARAHGLPVLAYLTCADTAAVDFFSHTTERPEQNEGLLMAPAYAVARMLQRAGLTLQDFDYYEIHEAFAAQVLCTLAAWESADYCRAQLGRPVPLGSIDRDRLNVNGSSLGTGHPFAATGARIVASLAKLLAQRGSGRGLVSICAAGGQGVVAILERPERMPS